MPLLSDLKVNDRWTYDSRPHESNSTLIILKIEDFSTGHAVHVQICDLDVKSPTSATGQTDIISHMPFDSETLLSCLHKRAGEVSETPDFQDGYDQWKDAEGGVFTIPVKDAIEYIEQIINGTASQ